MKGVVFTEFLEMVEECFSEEVADTIIETCDLPSEGSYTAVGTYDHAELVQLVGALSALVEIPVADLVRSFGRHLFRRFVVLYPRLFIRASSAFGFLREIETHIHSEVRKLYPDAELPSFECRELGSGQMEMIYRSQRGFADLAEGLILGCAEHFGEEIDVQRHTLPAEHGQAVRFVLRRAAEATACAK